MLRLAPSLAASFLVLIAVAPACVSDDGGGNDELGNAQDSETTGNGQDSETTGDGQDTETTGEAETTGQDSETTGEEEVDATAQIACSIWDANQVELVQSVMTQADANQVMLTPTDSTAYHITLNEDPEGGYVGWVNMSIPDWGSRQAIFAELDVDYELFRSEGMEPISMAENLECPDAGLSDQRIFFPHWADAQARFHADKPEVWFMFFKF